MNLREKLSKSPRLGRGAAVAFVLLAVGFVVLQTRSSNVASYGNTKAFFSVDDGKTWFIDSSTNVPPYDKGGKQAVEAFVFHGPGGPDFVGYLQRFTPDAKHALEQNQAQEAGSQKSLDATVLRNAFTVGRQVKRPGDPNWTSAVQFQKVMTIIVAKEPGGGPAVQVEP